MGKSKKEKKERKHKKEKKEKKEKRHNEKLWKELRRQSKSPLKLKSKHEEVLEENPKKFEKEPSFSASMADLLHKELTGESLNLQSDVYRLTPAQRKNRDREIENNRIYNERLINKPQPEDETERYPQSSSAHRSSSLVESCQFCIDNRPKHLIMSSGDNCFLTVPQRASMVEGHCLIVPFRHVPSGCHVDDETWEEVLKYRKQLAKMVAERYGSNSELVIIETAVRLNRFPHTVFECIPVPESCEDTPLLPAFFKKAFLEAGPKWASNKKLLEFKKKNLKHAVPRGFPYISVSFELNCDTSFVHVIDDENLYANHFLNEIIGGVLDLDPSSWRNPREEPIKDQLKKVVKFEQNWNKFDIWDTP